MIEIIIKYIVLYFTELLNLCNEMSPYLLFGFIIAGILHVYVKQERITKYLGKKNFKSVFWAAMIGVPLPLCSCGVIPAGVSIHKNGASKGAAVSFLISTPQTGVDSIFVTYSLLGLPFAIIRPIIAFVTGLFGGILTNISDKKDIEPKGEIVLQEEDHEHGKFRRFLQYAFVEFMQDIAKWLVIGLLLAALISVLVPNNFFTEYVNSPILSMLIMLAIAVPLYVCATGSVPIAAVLLMKGISPGAALVFLMAGPATNAATITVIGKTMGKKTLATYLGSIIGGALLFGLLIDYVLPSNLFTSGMIHNHSNHNHNEMLPYWISLSSTIILAILMINSMIQKYKPNNIHNHELNNNKTMPTLKLNVTGMTCNHCKANVEKNLMKVADISNVIANPTNNTVEITGENLDIKQIEDIINDLGYESKGKIE